MGRRDGRARPSVEDMVRHLYRSALIWTVVGLVGGVAYREFTKFNDYTGPTQLSVVHTHALALGTTLMLVLLALVLALPDLASDRRFRLAVPFLNGGLALMVVMLSVKGVLQVLDVSWQDHAAIAGIHGLGHIALAVGLVLMLLALGRATKEVRAGVVDARRDPSPATMSS